MSISRFKLLAFAALFGLLGFVSSGVLAEPTEEELGGLAKPLSEPISIDLIGTPLDRALETLGRETNQNILISPQFVGTLSGLTVTLRIEDLPASKALNLIGIATETDWFVREGVVMIAPSDYVRAMRTETRVYDIRELLESVPNYLGPDISVDGTLSNTSSGGSRARQSESYGSGGGGGGLFGDDSDSDLGEDMPSRQELVDQIVELIQSTVGDSDNWLDEDSTVTELNGNLIVKTVPEELDEIGELLSMLSAAGGRMIASEGQFFVVPRKMMDELDGNLLLDADGYKALMKKLGRDADANARRIASGRTICFNAQRVYIYAAADKALLSDLEPVPDAAGVDPTISTAHNGAVFDVKPTITIDGKHISVAVRTEAIDHAAMSTTPVPVGRVVDRSLRLSGSGDVEGVAKGAGPEGQDADVEGSASIGGSIGDPDEAEMTGNAYLGLPEQDIVRHRTNVRVTNGGAVVLTGVTGQFKNVDADQMEVIFVLRLQIME
jgi:hypothetical protein